MKFGEPIIRTKHCGKTNVGPIPNLEGDIVGEIFPTIPKKANPVGPYNFL